MYRSRQGQWLYVIEIRGREIIAFDVRSMSFGPYRENFRNYILIKKLEGSFTEGDFAVCHIFPSFEYTPAKGRVVVTRSEVVVEVSLAMTKGMDIVGYRTAEEINGRYQLLRSDEFLEDQRPAD